MSVCFSVNFILMHGPWPIKSMFHGSAAVRSLDEIKISKKKNTESTL